MDIGNVPCPFGAMDVTLVSVVEIVIAWNKKELGERRTEFFQTTQAKVQCLQIDGSTMVMPISQKHASLTSVSPPGIDDPIYEFFAVLIVQ